MSVTVNVKIEAMRLFPVACRGKAEGRRSYSIRGVTGVPSSIVRLTVQRRS